MSYLSGPLGFFFMLFHFFETYTHTYTWGVYNILYVLVTVVVWEWIWGQKMSFHRHSPPFSFSLKNTHPSNSIPFLFSLGNKKTNKSKPTIIKLRGKNTNAHTTKINKIHEKTKLKPYYINKRPVRQEMLKQSNMKQKVYKITLEFILCWTCPSVSLIYPVRLYWR